MRTLISTAVLTAELASVASAQAAPKILVVDLKKLIDESAEGKEFVGRLKKQMADKKDEFAGAVRQLQEQQKKLMAVELMNRDARWYDAVRAALDAQATLKVEEQYFVARINDQISRQVNELIRGAQEEARKIMKARGADLVLLSRMGPITINSDKELQDEIVFRRALATSPDLDITDEVMKQMDEWYRQNKTKRGLAKRGEKG
jgi:Skp family chaperone for outer membrane proteins